MPTCGQYHPTTADSHLLEPVSPVYLPRVQLVHRVEPEFGVWVPAAG